jgi:hypothetical protein
MPFFDNKRLQKKKGQPMKITRIYTGKDNESHFEDVVIPLIDKGDIGKLSQMVHASGIIFRETPPDYNFGWL